MLSQATPWRFGMSTPSRGVFYVSYLPEGHPKTLYANFAKTGVPGFKYQLSQFSPGRHVSPWVYQADTAKELVSAINRALKSTDVDDPVTQKFFCYQLGSPYVPSFVGFYNMVDVLHGKFDTPCDVYLSMVNGSWDRPEIHIFDYNNNQLPVSAMPDIGHFLSLDSLDTYMSKHYYHPAICPPFLHS